MTKNEDHFEEDFSEAMKFKNKILMAIESLPAAPAVAILNMAMTDVLLVTSSSKQSALELVDMISDQLKNSINSADKHGVCNWNNKTIQ